MPRWKKDDEPDTQKSSSREPARPPRNDPPRPPADTGTGGTATIGRSITIRGEVTGDEDLLIQGQVDGSVDLKKHSVTVGPEGQVKAGIIGRTVTVEGTVKGDLSGTEQVILRSTAHVEGDITAARVVLEDGATFRGGVDMGETAGAKKAAGSKPSDQASRSGGSKAPSTVSSASSGSDGKAHSSKRSVSSAGSAKKTTGAAT